ncbi:OmpA family protein [Aquincola sp. S2]|uniref:OmpA family protein n=1 Tax=Pseudaquabacterium terrae TaxID=2732868 RepID=A0ABX2ENI3_9BURK|nr:OmpA family protein [Aquabacterium terrae]NRF70173.1 OmpA family protein [Aquabacterium terrae]
MAAKRFHTLIAPIALSSLLACAGAALATDFGKRTPEVKELVDALKPSAQPAERTRGLAVVGAAATAAKPSASMQVGFDFGSAEVISRDVVKIDRLAEALKSDSLREYKYLVIGHTDAVGPLPLNMQLSRDRAASVVNHLKRQGVAAERIVFEGRGPNELLNPRQPDAAENRRVEVRLMQ